MSWEYLIPFLIFTFSIVLSIIVPFLPQVWAYEHRILERPFPISQEEVVYLTLARWGESTVSHDVGTHRARLNVLIWDMVSLILRYFLFIY